MVVQAHDDIHDGGWFMMVVHDAVQVWWVRWRCP